MAQHLNPFDQTSTWMIINATILVSLFISSSTAAIVVINNGNFGVFDPTNNYFGACIYKTTNYTQKSEYQSNLLTVFSNLTSAAASSRNFSYETAGLGANKVNGWFYCSSRRHSDPGFCSACVRNSTLILSDMCLTKAAIVYTGADCQVSYSNSETLPISDVTFLADCIDTLPRMPDLDQFNQTVTKSIERLIDKVVSPSSSSNWAADAIPGLYVGQKVYTLVTCLPGVTKSQCKDCLLLALNDTMVFCLGIGKAGATDFGPTCQMSYGLNPLLPAPAPAPAPAFSPVPSSPPPVLESFATPGMSSWPLNLLLIIVIVEAIIL